MNSRDFICSTLFAAAASLASAETLTYNRAESGSFYDGSYWGGTVPSSSSDILFNDTNKEVAYKIGATAGVTINSLTDNSITNRIKHEGYNPWGNNIVINVGESTFTILNDLTLASNHNYAPFAFKSSSDGVGRVEIGGNIIAKEASDGSEGESLFGDGNLLQSVKVGGNIELQNMRLRFHTQNLSVAGILNYSGGQLNLFYGSGSNQTLSYSFGGINGTNKTIQFGGNPDRVFIGGHSAGAYLAGMVGFNPAYLEKFGHKNTDIAGMCLISGQMTTHFQVKKDLGYKGGQFLPVIDKYAILNFVENEVAPLLIVTGEEPLEWPCRVAENRLLLASVKKIGKCPLARMSELGGYGHNCAQPSAGLISNFIKDADKLYKKP